MHIRFADPGDAAACLAVYAQYIDTSITFETVLPSEAEFSGRIRSYGAVYPWLIAEEDGHVLAYAYAHRAQERAAYGWTRPGAGSARSSIPSFSRCCRSRACARPTAS